MTPWLHSERFNILAGLKMPWRSSQQGKWGHSPSGLSALGGKAKVAEWDKSTPKGSLLQKVGAFTSASRRKNG